MASTLTRSLFTLTRNITKLPQQKHLLPTLASIPTIAQRHLSCSRPDWSKAFVTQPAPDFEATAVLPNGEFAPVKLSDYKDKYLVFFFYPLDFTFVCPTEIIAFSDRLQEFKDINCEVLACSVDSHFSHLAWTQMPRKKGGLGKMNFPIIADLTKSISEDYGVLLQGAGISLRGLFIIDPKGAVRQITINDLPVGRSVDETLRLVKAFQFVEEHGEVCPAGWNPGADTIKPGVKESLEYFEKQEE